MASRKAQKAQKKAERLAREQRAREEARRRRLMILIGSAVAVVIAVVGVVFILNSSDSASGPQLKGANQVNASLQGVPQKEDALGDPKAPVTVVEFADLQCPFCRDFSNQVLPKIVDNYVKSGKVRMELRLLSFIGPDSERAARWAQYAGQQGLMWNFAELFYKNQGAEGTGYANKQFLTAVARGAGVSPMPSPAQLTSPSVDKALSDSSDQAQKVRIDATPSFLIGPTGGKLQKLDNSNYSYEAFAAAIDSFAKSAK